MLPFFPVLIAEEVRTQYVPTELPVVSTPPATSFVTPTPPVVPVFSSYEIDRGDESVEPKVLPELTPTPPITAGCPGPPEPKPEKLFLVPRLNRR
jgi:hypothetical protein